MGIMPAVYGDIMGAKLVNVYPDNAALGLPTHQAIIAIFRSDTGEPLAVMDGRLITELRTAAVSAVATRLLSSPGARTLADSRQRSAGAGPRPRTRAGTEVRRDPRLEPQSATCADIRPRDRRNVDLGGRSRPRCRCRSDVYEFARAGAPRSVAETRRSDQCRGCSRNHAP